MAGPCRDNRDVFREPDEDPDILAFGNTERPERGARGRRRRLRIFAAAGTLVAGLTITCGAVALHNGGASPSPAPAARSANLTVTPIMLAGVSGKYAQEQAAEKITLQSSGAAASAISGHPKCHTGG
jgi:hypothetical protein